MVKVAHIADVHIRNLKYHDVYRNVFEQLYKNLEKDKPDFIVVCGDIAHTKTQISPEYVKMASDFFISLAEIAKTIVIPGNHDGLVKNTTRMDAITPIIENIENKNLFFTRDSGVMEFKDIDFYHLSIFDRENWPKPRNSKKISVALYHGAIDNVETDVGYSIAHGDDKLAIFNGFDYAMLGDIHKTNQKVDKEGTVRYPGSLISQNFGETNDKGYLYWHIADKKNFKCKHVQLANPKPFITVKLTPKGRLPRKLNIQKGARVRIVSEHHISLDSMRKAIDVVKLKFKPESVSYLNRASKNSKRQNLIDDEFSNKNLRDLAVQEEMIQEYLSDYDLEEKMLKKIFEINRYINTMIQKNDNISRNVYWELESLEYDNLFNYGEGNKVDFGKINGLIGIFGKSYSGKSSIVDSLLYTLFNNTSKPVRKNYDLINQNKSFAKGKAIFSINDQRFVVERKSDKYKKKLHGVETEEAKTSVEFYEIDADGKKLASLDDESRQKTDNKIRNKIGDLDDFFVTSFAAQFDSLAFIDQKSTDRKKMLAKFLDLEFFEDKFKEATEQSSDLRGALKSMETVDYAEVLDDLKKKKDFCLSEIARFTKTKKQISDELSLEKDKLRHINDFIDSIPEELEDLSHLKEETVSKKKEKNRVEAHLVSKKKELKDLKDQLVELENDINSIDLEEMHLLKEKVEELREKYRTKFDDKIYYENIVEQIEDAQKNIEEAPCHSDYSSCYLVESSHKFLENINNSLKVREKLEKIQEECEKVTQEIDELTKVDADAVIEEVQSLKNTMSQIEEYRIPILESEIEKYSIMNVSLIDEISTLEGKMKTYEENKEKIDALDQKKNEKELTEAIILSCELALEEVESDLNELYSNRGYIKQKIENTIENRKKLEEMREEYTAYDLYKKCMHANGIPFDIIKKRLPVINAEISKILANVVEFEVFFETSDNRLEIYLRHPKHEARLIETGSGAEKTLSATAIRLALLSVSSLPKGDIFVLDEPATELDDETKEGFLRILDLIKTYFNKVILISHLEPLKDIVDTEITIEKKNGFAHVVV